MTNLTTPDSRRVVVATGTLAIVSYRLDDGVGTIEIPTVEINTRDVAIGHARFIAPHVLVWNVVEVA